MLKINNKNKKEKKSFDILFIHNISDDFFFLIFQNDLELHFFAQYLLTTTCKRLGSIVTYFKYKSGGDGIEFPFH